MIETSNPAIHPTSIRGLHEQPALMLVLGRWLAGDILQLQLTVSTLDGGLVPMGIRRFSISVDEDADVLQIAAKIATTLSQDELLNSGYDASEVAVRPAQRHHQLMLQPAIVFKPEGPQPRLPEPDDNNADPLQALEAPE